MFNGKLWERGAGKSGASGERARVSVRVFPPSRLARAVEVDWQEFRQSVFRAFASSYFISRDLNRRVDAVVRAVQSAGLDSSVDNILGDLGDWDGKISLSAKAVEAARSLVETALEQHQGVLRERARDEEDLSKPFVFEVVETRGWFRRKATRYKLEGGGRRSLEGLISSAVKRELGRLLDLEGRVRGLEGAREREGLVARLDGVEARLDGLVEARTGENLDARVRELEARVGGLVEASASEKLVERVQSLEALLKALEEARVQEGLVLRVQALGVQVLVERVSALESGLKSFARRTAFVFKFFFRRLRAVEEKVFGSSGRKRSGDGE